MAAWTKTDVTGVCPELVTSPAIADGTFDLFIGIAERQIDPAAFGARIVEAGAYLTAHLMIRAGYGSSSAGAAGSALAAGPLSSVSVGKISVSFASLAAGGSGADSMEAELLTTRPGAQFLSQVRLCVASPIVLDSEIPGVL